MNEVDFMLRKKLHQMMAEFVMLALLGHGVWKLTQVQPEANITTAIIQAGEPHWVYQMEPYKSEFETASANIHLELTRQALIEKPQLVVWPEGIIRPTTRSAHELKTRLPVIAQKGNAVFIAGDYTNDENNRARNSALYYSSQGKLIGRYDKNHLVPLIEKFIPSKNLNPIQTEVGNIGTLICFESIYPQFARKQVLNGAEALVLLTNDSLFRDTRIVRIHTQRGILRAVENGRYLIRAGQSGPSFIADPLGRIKKQSAYYEETYIKDQFALRNELTLFTRYGNYFPVLCLLFLIITGLRFLVIKTR